MSVPDTKYTKLSISLFPLYQFKQKINIKFGSLYKFTGESIDGVRFFIMMAFVTLVYFDMLPL